MTHPNILIVDDDPEVLRVITEGLSKSYKCLTASDGGEALQYLARTHIDCILLDIRMSGMDGISFLKKIRSEENWTKVIVMTGVSTQETAEICADLEVSGYIVKPFSLSDLRAKLRKVLHKMAAAVKGDASPDIDHPRRRKIVEYLHTHYRRNLQIDEAATRTDSIRSHHNIHHDSYKT